MPATPILPDGQRRVKAVDTVIPGWLIDAWHETRARRFLSQDRAVQAKADAMTEILEAVAESGRPATNGDDQ